MVSSPGCQITTECQSISHITHGREECRSILEEIRYPFQPDPADASTADALGYGHLTMSHILVEGVKCHDGRSTLKKTQLRADLWRGATF